MGGGLFEFDALSERELLAVVNGTSGTAHVLLPRVAAALTTAARMLLAACNDTILVRN